MTRVITSACVGTKDASCVDVCPVDCIHPHTGDEDDAFKETFAAAKHLYIDPDECIDCGACEPACPVDAIFPDDEVPDDQSEWIKINADFFS